jgi:hypothetical protein
MKKKNAKWHYLLRLPLTQTPQGNGIDKVFQILFCLRSADMVADAWLPGQGRQEWGQKEVKLALLGLSRFGPKIVKPFVRRKSV